MAIKGEQRGQIFRGSELRANVRASCLAEFQERFRKPWEVRWETILIGSAAEDGEREAQILYERLRSAMQDASKFAKNSQYGRQCAMFLRWWVPQNIDPLLGHAAMDTVDWGKPIEEPRARLVALLDRLNVLDLPDAVDGGSSFLDPRDYAVVSLLLGNWPAKDRGTVAEVVASEVENMRHHVKTHGAKDAAPPPKPLPDDFDHTQIIVAKRGPKHRATTKPKK